jgi:hypothetical protein
MAGFEPANLGSNGKHNNHYTTKTDMCIYVCVCVWEREKSLYSTGILYSNLNSMTGSTDGRTDHSFTMMSAKVEILLSHLQKLIILFWITIVKHKLLQILFCHIW